MAGYDARIQYKGVVTDEKFTNELRFERDLSNLLILAVYFVQYLKSELQILVTQNILHNGLQRTRLFATHGRVLDQFLQLQRQ